jgi:hypothetical protein
VTSADSNPAQIRRGLYQDPALDEDFWVWLKAYLPAADYAACAEQPRAFVQALHQEAWSAFVEDLIEEERDKQNWQLILEHQAANMIPVRFETWEAS